MNRQMYRLYDRKNRERIRRKKKRRRQIALWLIVLFAAAFLGAAAWAVTGGRESRVPIVPGEDGTADVNRTAGADMPDAGVTADAGGAGDGGLMTAGAALAYTTAASENDTAGRAGGSPARKGAGLLAGPGAELSAGSGAEAAAGENETADDGRAVLLFGGDVYLSDYVLNAYDAAGGISGVLDEGIRREIAESDIFMVNQEFPFTDRGEQTAGKEFTFRIPPARVNILKEMGADIVTMANNHILDFGAVGITDSIAALDSAGIRHVGAGENLEQASRLEVMEAGGMKVGFLGTSRVYMDSSWAAGSSHPGVFSTYDPGRALEAIRQAKSQCDYLVVYVHWGVEKAAEPQEYQRTMGREYIDAGADLVVGSHPHVLQEIEYYNGKPIVHSLGNFVFGSSIPETELLKVVIKDGQAEVSTIPCRSSNGYTRLK